MGDENENVEGTENVVLELEKKVEFPSFLIPPWPEWSDEEINRDNWQDTECVENGLFVDPFGKLLPPGVQVLDWVRPSDLFANPKIVTTQLPKMDLISPNYHLCELSSFYRTLLVEISQLYELGLVKDFLCEGEYSVYAPNSDLPWKPWDHVYGLNPAGRNGSKPKFNPKGRYIVRLYFMGSWRKIVVDDRIPILQYGLFGLPVTETLELWPMLLTKALLKIAFVTGGISMQDGVNHFSPISCLTGWIFDANEIKSSVNPEGLWSYLNEILPKYRSPSLPRRKLPSDFEYPTDSLFLLKRDQTPVSTKGKREKSKKKGKKGKGKKGESSESGSKKKKSKKKKGGSKTASETETEPDSKSSKGKKEKTPDASATEDASENEASSKEKKSKKSKKGKDGKDKKSKKGKKGKKSKKGKKGKKAITSESESEAPAECPKESLAEPQPDSTENLPKTCIPEVVPPMTEIIAGVQKYVGPLYHSAMIALEASLGKDSPHTVSVLYKDFPPDETGFSLDIPPCIHHPMQLFMVRDCPLKTDVCQPPTPRWKTFRWKKWAMKKGLIPRDDTADKGDIKSILNKTPLSWNWLKVKLANSKESPDKLDQPDKSHEEIELSILNPPGPVEFPLRFKIPSGSTFRDLQQLIASSQAPSAATTDTESVKSGKGKKNKKGKGKSKSTSGTSASESKGKKKGKGKKKKPEKTSKNKAEKGESKTKLKKSKSKSKSKSGSRSKKDKKSKKKGHKSETSGDEDSSRPSIVPDQACGDIWIDLKDLSEQLITFQKYYPTRNAYGNNYILRRHPRTAKPEVSETEAKVLDFEWADGEKALKISTVNLPIKAPENTRKESYTSRRITIDIQEWQMNNIDDLDNGFYLFSDTWTSQDLIFSLDVMQEVNVSKFIQIAKQETEGIINDGISPTTPVTVVVKQWDWRQDCCLEGKVYVLSTNTSKVVHLPLPPGRNLFRILLVEQVHQGGCINSTSQPHFTLKVVSQTPIVIGGREEIQNLMTTETMLYRRQTDVLARSVWALLLAFGQSRYLLGKSLRTLRQAYCPAYSHRNFVNRMIKDTHENFEYLFLQHVLEANGGKLNRWTLITVRALFLNPKLGHQIPIDDFVDAEKLKKRRQEMQNKSDDIICTLVNRHSLATWECVATVIQRYFRGWYIRKLFQVRSKKFKHFHKIQYELDKIALYFARTLNPEFHFKPVSDPLEIEQLKSSRTDLVPKNVTWASGMLDYLIQRNQWLLTVFPHATSLPLKTRIKDIVGKMPTEQAGDWIPFFRHRLDCYDESSEWKFRVLDLQTYPNEGVVVALVDNDTNTVLSNLNNRLFIGKLPTKENGYTILCYKLLSLEKRLQPGREHLKNWKLRLITPDEGASENFRMLYNERTKKETKEPTALSMYRFTGYYIPNDDFCVCRYTLELPETPAIISIRFQASLEQAKFTLRIWDLSSQVLLFEQEGTGGVLIPSFKLLPAGSHHGKNTWRGYGGCHFHGINEESGEYGMPEDYHYHHESPKPVQKYAVGVFVEKGSWPLTEEEWRFVQYQTKKFWKKMMVFRETASEFDKILEAEREKKRRTLGSGKGSRSSKSLTSSSRRVSWSRSQSAGDESRKSSRGLSKRGNSGLKETSLRKQSVTAPPSARQDKSSAGLSNGGGEADDEAEDVLAKVAESQIQEINSQDPSETDGVSDEEDYEPARGIYENLTVMEGGQDSQRISDIMKPHWTLEILTDAYTEIAFMSNRREFREKLVETKLKWERNQEGRYIRGRRERHKFLAKNLVCINTSDNLASLTEQMSKFYSCLYLEKDHLDGLVTSDWLPSTASLVQASEPVMHVTKDEADKTLVGSNSKKSSKKSIISPRSGESTGTEVTFLQRTKSTSKSGNVSKKKSAKRAKSKSGKSEDTVQSGERSDEQSVKPSRSKVSKKRLKATKSKDPTSGQNIIEKQLERPGSEEFAGRQLETPKFGYQTYSEGGKETVENFDQEKSLDCFTNVAPSLANPTKTFTPPPQPPTHILTGPEIQKCGVKDPKQLKCLDKKFISIIRGTPWKVQPRFQKQETAIKLEIWKEELRQMRQEFQEALGMQQYEWKQFQEYFYESILCELEANRCYLEESRLKYAKKNELRSPGRSSQEFKVTSMGEIRELLKKPVDLVCCCRSDISKIAAVSLGGGDGGTTLEVEGISELEYDCGTGCPFPTSPDVFNEKRSSRSWLGSRVY